MKKSILALTIAGLFTTSAYATCASTACQNVEITNIYVQADGQTFIQTSGDESQLTGCTARAGAYIILSTTAIGKNQIYSALLTAATTKKKITVQVQADGSSECEIAYLSM